MSKNNFHENYDKLHKIVTKLKEEEQVDIDQLLPIIKEATSAYKVCKNKIEKVKSALQDHLSKNEPE